jgi:hypothetical protein
VKTLHEELPSLLWNCILRIWKTYCVAHLWISYCKYSCEDLFKSCFPPLLLLSWGTDCWTGSVIITLNTYTVILSFTPSKWLMNSSLIQITLIYKKPFLVYLAESTLLMLTYTRSLDPDIFILPPYPPLHEPYQCLFAEKKYIALSLATKVEIFEEDQMCKHCMKSFPLCCGIAHCGPKKHIALSISEYHIVRTPVRTCLNLVFLLCLLLSRGIDCWTGNVLITLNTYTVILYSTPSKWLKDRSLIQITLIYKKPFLVYLAESTLLMLTHTRSLDPDIFVLPPPPRFMNPISVCSQKKKILLWVLRLKLKYLKRIKCANTAWRASLSGAFYAKIKQKYKPYEKYIYIYVYYLLYTL